METVAILVDLVLDLLEEFRLAERDLREQDHDRQVAVLAGGHATGGCNPAGVPAHDFEHEHLGRGRAHGGDVKAGLAGGNGNVLGDGAETRAVVGDRQVVVDRLRHVNRLDRVTGGLGELRDFQAGVGGVAATVIEEVTDVVGGEDLDQAVVLALVGLQALHLVAAGAEGAARGVAQGGNGARGFLAGVDQVFRQRSDDAVAAGIDLADLVLVLACRLDHAAGGGIDYRGHAAGLCIESVFLTSSHQFLLP